MRAFTRFKAAAAVAAAAVLAAACGGGTADASADGQARGLAVAPSAAQLHLFAPDLENAAVAGFAPRAPGAGEMLAPRVIALQPGIGNNVQLDRARDQLYAISGRHVVVFGDAASLAAGARPVRRFPLPATLRTPRTLYLDRMNDVLYVGGDAAGGGAIVAYAAAHTVSGISAKPARTLFVEGGVAFFTLDVLRRRFYVADAGGAVRAYADLDAARGQLVPVATYPVLGSGLAVDAVHDRLYVADLFAGLILVDHASAPAAAVSATLSIPDARQVAFDAQQDRAIVSAGHEFYVLEHASALGPASALPAPATAPGLVLGAVDWR